MVQALVRRFQLVVVDSDDMRDLEPLLEPWIANGVDLVGPFVPAAVSNSVVRQADGVVISLNVDPVSAVALAELLDIYQVPYLFFVDSRLVPATSCYVLGKDGRGIRRILQGLAVQGSDSQKLH